MQKEKENSFLYLIGLVFFSPSLISVSVIGHTLAFVNEIKRWMLLWLPDSPAERSLLMNFNYVCSRNWQLIVIWVQT